MLIETKVIYHLFFPWGDLSAPQGLVNYLNIFYYHHFMFREYVIMLYIITWLQYVVMVLTRDYLWSWSISICLALVLAGSIYLRYNDDEYGGY